MYESVTRVFSNRFGISMPSLMLIIPLLIGLTGCAGEEAGGAASNPDLAHADGGDTDPVITMTPTATGVTAQLSWDPPPHFEAAGYDIYYGKHSPEEISSDESGSEDLSSTDPPSCTRGERQSVDGPQATVTSLEPNTQYFFVIRAFNEDQSETICSNEFTAETTPAHS